MQIPTFYVPLTTVFSLSYLLRFVYSWKRKKKKLRERGREQEIKAKGKEGEVEGGNEGRRERERIFHQLFKFPVSREGQFWATWK